MKRSNELMSQNLVVMEESKERIEENTFQVTRSTKTMSRSTDAIQENTHQVIRSTETMKEFEGIIDENTALIKNISGKLELHPNFFLIVLIAILALLFLPSIILLILYQKILKSLHK